MRKLTSSIAVALLGGTLLASVAVAETNYYFRTGGTSTSPGTGPVVTDPDPDPDQNPDRVTAGPVRFRSVQAAPYNNYGSWNHTGEIRLIGESTPMDLRWDPVQTASPFATGISIAQGGATATYVTEGGCNASVSISPTSEPRNFSYSLSVTAPSSEANCSTQPLGLVATDTQSNVAHWASASQLDLSEPERSENIAVSGYGDSIYWSPGETISTSNLWVAPGDQTTLTVSSLFEGRSVNCLEQDGEEYQCTYRASADRTQATYTVSRDDGTTATVAFALTKVMDHDWGNGTTTEWSLRATQSGDFTLSRLSTIPMIVRHTANGEVYGTGNAQPSLAVAVPPPPAVAAPRFIDPQGNDVTDAATSGAAMPDDGAALPGFIAKSASSTLYLAARASFDRSFTGYTENARPENQNYSGSEPRSVIGLPLTHGSEDEGQDGVPYLTFLPSASNGISGFIDGLTWVGLTPVSSQPDENGLYSFQIDSTISKGVASRVRGGGDAGCREWRRDNYSNVVVTLLAAADPVNGAHSRVPVDQTTAAYEIYREEDPPFCPQ